MDTHPVDRRRFLRWSVAGTGIALTGPWLLEGCRARPVGARRGSDAHSVSVFSPDQRAVLAAAAARILPSEPGSPGATEADAISAIERTLADSYYAYKAPRFRDGANTLNILAQQDWKRDFVDLAAADQDRCLLHVQQGKSDTPAFRGGLFFDDLIVFTLEGFLGHPRHGGNRNKVGWEFIGYEPGGPGPGECHGE